MTSSKYYYIEIELDDSMPRYSFIVESLNTKQALKLARKQLEDCYAEFNGLAGITATQVSSFDDLIKLLKIN